MLNRRQCLTSLSLLPFITIPLKPESQYHLTNSFIHAPCSSIIYNDIVRPAQFHIIELIGKDDAGESYHLSFVLKMNT